MQPSLPDSPFEEHTEVMRIFLKFVLDCDPDAAWLALRTPSVFRAVASPLLAFESLEPSGFPAVWPGGPHLVAGYALDLVPVGEQVIDLSFHRVRNIRLVRDSGRPVSGRLAVVTRWRHTMAVSPLADGGTLYRDRLEFGAGLLTPLLWPALWAFWQYRGWRIRTLAKRWRA